MCGIAGYLSCELVDQAKLHQFTWAMRHRGPDDCGTYVSRCGHVGLAQTRLSILDLTAAGHQPMSTEDGRYTIVFNGEIYNYRDLRRDLQAEGIRCNSDSDTEVLLRMYAQQGANMLGKLAGMFAFAIWDDELQTCFLARDPLGIKPLYYWSHGSSIVFGSEIRTIVSSELTGPKIDELGLAKYLLYGNVPDPHSLIAGMRSLPAGHSMTWRGGVASISQYWVPTYGAVQTTEAEAVARTRIALEESLDRHLVSDVPVGIFLSGGLDSTTLLALASSKTSKQYATFCISFDEQEFNEGRVAEKTASHFNSEHHDWRLTSEQGRELVDEFLNSLDCPSNDGFNTFCVSKFARSRGFKVVLSGLGGDELFGSYPSFREVPRLMRIGRLIATTGPGARWVGKQLEQFATRRSLNRLGVFLQSQRGPMAAYWAMRGFFTPKEVAQLVDHYTGKCELDVGSILEEAVTSQPTLQDSVAYLESTRYMRSQLLRDSDVFSMAHGLELRVPFADSRLFDVVNHIPASIRLAPGKKLLCDAVPELPPWVLNAPKKGFRFPFEKWVNDLWKDRFSKLEQSLPVRTGTWYRKWALFTLEQFLKVCGVS